MNIQTLRNPNGIPRSVCVRYVTKSKELFPGKVWRDCFQHSPLEACDKTAMVLPLRLESESTPVPSIEVLI